MDGQRGEILIIRPCPSCLLLGVISVLNDVLDLRGDWIVTCKAVNQSCRHGPDVSESDKLVNYRFTQLAV